MLTDFWTWIIDEARRGAVEPAVLQGYEGAFRDELRRLIGRTSDPELRRKLEAMLDCPVRTSRGCQGFAAYIHASLLKNGIHNQFDVEAALQYVIEKMLMTTAEDTGKPKANLFAGFTTRQGETPDFNPVQ